MNYVLSYEFEKIDQHEINIVNMRTSADENRDVFSGIPTTTEMGYSNKWYCSQGHGRMYRRKYIDAFKSNIVEMFNAGYRDKYFRMGAGRMLEKTKRKYPGQLDIPFETETQQAI